MSKDAIVVFDEAHNIDNVCIESLSIDLTRPMLDSASRSVTALEDKIKEIKRTDAGKLQEEYARLVEGLEDSARARDEDSFMGNPGACSVPHIVKVAALLIGRCPCNAQSYRTTCFKKLYRATSDEPSTSPLS